MLFEVMLILYINEMVSNVSTADATALLPSKIGSHFHGITFYLKNILTVIIQSILSPHVCSAMLPITNISFELKSAGLLSRVKAATSL